MIMKGKTCDHFKKIVYILILYHVILSSPYIYIVIIGVNGRAWVSTIRLFSVDEVKT